MAWGSDGAYLEWQSGFPLHPFQGKNHVRCKVAELESRTRMLLSCCSPNFTVEASLRRCTFEQLGARVDPHLLRGISLEERTPTT